MKNYIITILFLLIILGGMIFSICIEDKAVSQAERRRLKQFPKVSASKIFNGDFVADLDEYFIDQIVGRDQFRSIKAVTHFKILGQKDNNGFFVENGKIYKHTGLLKEKEIQKAAEKFATIQQSFLKNNNVYFSIIPDKNYYLKDNDLRMDYEKLENIMLQNLPNMQYIDLFSLLNQDDYYKTDTHWKQENMLKVAEKLANNMDANVKFEDIKIHTKGKFYGVYAGQLGLNSDMHDELRYITSPIIENSVTFNLETKQKGNIYDEAKWQKSSDKYDYFVSGATPFITIENPESVIKKELVIFRDSFASSLAPLLVEGYSKITLIDIRYMFSKELDKYINFENKDILFLYSTLVLNDASILK